MKKALEWLVASFVVTFCAATATAAPITYVFDLPSWTFTNSAPVFGSNAILSVTLDNGSASSINQTYLNSEIVSTTLAVSGGTFDHTWNSALCCALGLSYISTDASGIASLNLLANSSTSVVFFDDSPFYMQWGILDPVNGGPTTFVVSGDGFSTSANIVPVDPASGNLIGLIVSSRESSQVPEPGGLALLGLGLAGLAAKRGRRR